MSGEITDGGSRGPFRGPVDQWVEELAALALERRVDTFVLWADGDGQVERFVEEIVPAVRARVTADRVG